MPIITVPTIVQQAIDEYLASLFKNEPQRNHLAIYLSGLMISPNKTIAGMTSEFPNASDQSCLNRFITEVDWDEKELNRVRIEMLQEQEETKFHPKGVIAIDDVLLEKSGKSIPNSGTLWDHSDERYIHAQDLIIANYVNPISKRHYPLDFRFFKKEDQCEWTGDEFKKMTELVNELVDWCQETNVPGCFTFDSFYTCASIQNHINSLKNADGSERGYVGDLKFNRKVIFKGKEQSATNFAQSIPSSDRKKVVVNGEIQWALTVCVKMPNIDHKVRIVCLWKHKNDKEPRKILATNKIHWNLERIVETYGSRWTGTETFHRDGKQELGLGDCQLRDPQGQTRHIYLVFLAHSLLIQELGTNSNDWTTAKMSTIGECCRELLREALRNLIGYIVVEIESVARLGRNVSKSVTGILRRLGLEGVHAR